MSREHRAKQFMPFNGLRGYYDLVEEAEIVPSSFKELDQDEIDKLSAILNSVKKKDMVKVTYFKKYGYTTLTGLVSKIDITFRKLVVIDEEIDMKNIYSIEIINHIYN